MRVQLRPVQVTYLGPSSTDPLSFHCMEWEVLTALWGQPDAVPSALRGSKPGPSPKPAGPNSPLGTGGPEVASWDQPIKPAQSPITLMPPLGLQANVTKLGEFIFQVKQTYRRYKILSFRCGIDCLLNLFILILLRIEIWEISYYINTSEDWNHKCNSKSRRIKSMFRQHEKKFKWKDFLLPVVFCRRLTQAKIWRQI